MCGIVGFFRVPGAVNPEGPSGKVLDSMMECIAHRGPDDRGSETGPWYGLGHLRLSILDTSSLGHQPMSCAQNRFSLIYNGEIYNYRSLRASLEQKGHRFKSDSDTEALLYGLIEEGIDFLKRCEGMFAGAFVDKTTQKAFLFRDQLGIKPLYYAIKESTLYFSSEIKGLKPALTRFSVNTPALYEHFKYRYVAGEQTLYSDVNALLPGHYIEINSRGLQKKSYYSLLDSLSHSQHKKPNLDDIEAMLEESIKAHTLSDVGYSVQLSGGIDSSYITAILTKQNKELDTYSVSLPGYDLDESPYQKEVVRRCGTRHHDFAYTAQEFADLLPAVTYTTDAPVMHTGTVFLYELCRNIARDHKVVLTGEGADELFLGYSRYEIPQSHKLAFLLKQAGVRAEWIPAVSKMKGLKSLLSHDLGLDAGSYHSEHESLLLLQGDVTYRKDITGSFDTLIEKMIASDQSTYLVSLFERQDKIAMAHGLESRVPFCTPRLFEAINGLRHSDKISPTPKALLKQLANRYFPHDFVYRRKNGFKLPVDLWLNDTKLLGRYFDLLTDQSFKDRGFYNHPLVDRAIEKHRRGEADFSKELWALITFEIWCRQI